MAFKQFPVLETDRLLIDRLTKSDRNSIYGIFSDKRVVENYDVERFRDISEADNLVDYFDARFESFTGIRWGARCKKTKKLIGTIGFTTWNEFDHSVNLGYDLAFEHWGKGYASEMMQVLIQYVFSKDFPFFVNRIEASILPHNKHSIRLVKRFGFVFEGTLRDKCFWNGGFHSMDLYSLLRSDLAQ